MIGIGMIEYSKKGDANKFQAITFIDYFGEETYAAFKKYPSAYIGKGLSLFKKGLESLPLNKKIKNEILYSEEYDRTYKLFFVVEQVIMKYSSAIRLEDVKVFICDSISKFSNAGIVINEAYLNNIIHCTNCSAPVYPTVPEYFENNFDNEHVQDILENNKNNSLYDDICSSFIDEDISDSYKGLCKYMILNDHEFVVIEADYILDEIYIIQHNVNGKILEV